VLREIWIIAIVFLIACSPREQQPATVAPNAWQTALEDEVTRLDVESEGTLGVYVQRLDDGSEFHHASDKKWYLASTTKVLVAIVALQHVDSGELSLEHRVTLKGSDHVDGGGTLRFRPPGTRISVRTLLEQMLTYSDSTAADLLIKLVGERELNRQLATFAEAGSFGRITSLLQVRYDAYSMLHTRARELTNQDFIRLKSVPISGRLQAFMNRLNLSRSDLGASSIEAAFERYYETGRNSGTLSGFGRVLAALWKGELLSSGGTALLLRFMERMRTGEHRIKAGLPTGLKFAQKTGTQSGRVCNVGIVRETAPEPPRRKPRGVVVAACVADFSRPAAAEAVLQKLGRAVGALFVREAAVARVDRSWNKLCFLERDGYCIASSPDNSSRLQQALPYFQEDKRRGKRAFRAQGVACASGGKSYPY